MLNIKKKKSGAAQKFKSLKEMTNSNEKMETKR